MEKPFVTGELVRIRQDSTVISQRGMRGVVESGPVFNSRMIGLYVPILAGEFFFYPEELERVPESESVKFESEVADWRKRHA